jgi:hypothetical protein
MERMMSTDVPNEAKQGCTKPSVERFFRYSTEPHCTEIDSSGQLLSKAFLECIAKLPLNTAEPLGSRGFYELAPPAPPCPSRLPEDRIVASATTTTSASSTTS